MNFETLLEHVLSEEFDSKLHAAVGIVECGNRWLLGLSTADDDRHNHWVFPGGGIKRGETPEKAAVREVWEETGIRVKAVGKAFTIPGKKGVAFVHCTARKGQEFENNHEFTCIGWFRRQDFKGLRLYHNVIKLIDRVK